MSQVDILCCLNFHFPILCPVVLFIIKSVIFVASSVIVVLSISPSSFSF
jgi:hypothetical protein